MNFKKLITSAAFTFGAAISASSQAALIDFTDGAWSTVNGKTSETIDGVTVTSTNGDLTFNSGSGEINGCKTSWAVSGSDINLACAGDGLGVGNDEMTGNSFQTITVTFSGLVNVIAVEILDLFPNEGGDGIHEIAIINGINTFEGTSGSGVGGYMLTGFTANNVTSLTFSANDDGWSDFALARITTSTVPEPSSLALLGLGLIGISVLRRRHNRS